MVRLWGISLLTSTLRAHLAFRSPEREVIHSLVDQCPTDTWSWSYEGLFKIMVKYISRYHLIYVHAIYDMSSSYFEHAILCNGSSRLVSDIKREGGKITFTWLLSGLIHVWLLAPDLYWPSDLNLSLCKFTVVPFCLAVSWFCRK